MKNGRVLVATNAGQVLLATGFSHCSQQAGEMLLADGPNSLSDSLVSIEA
jgi:hypothetical protein